MVYPQALELCPLPDGMCEMGRGYERGFERPQRKGHKKSRRGCYECKRRKIKVLFLSRSFPSLPLSPLSTSSPTHINIPPQCQETRPVCSNCIRLSLRCRYLPDAAAVVTKNVAILQPFSSLQISNVFSLTDMRLFHHFIVAAWPHLPVRGDNVWLEYVVPIGHQVSPLTPSLVV